MLEEIQAIGTQICEWDTAPLLLFSENVFSNLIYYSHLLPALSSIVFGTLIFMSGRKKLINRVLSFVMFAFALWALFDLILWATERVDLIMFFWSALAYLEPLIYMGCLYLVYVFCFGKDISWKAKGFLFLLFLPVVILAPSPFNLTGFDFTNCEREAIEGSLWYYIYALEILIAAAIAIVGTKGVFSQKDSALRRQNVLITIGTILFLVTFSFGNIIGNTTLDWSVAQYGLFGMPIFIAFLAYLVVQYQRFNTKVFATQILIGSLLVLILSLLFIQDLFLLRIIVGFTFVLALVFGSLLNSAISGEIRQKEELEKLTGELKKSNKYLEELNKQKSEFVSFATHQLRSPLTAMKGYSSMVREGDFGETSTAILNVFGVIEKSTRTLIDVVESYLNLSRIELGTMKYQMNNFDLKDLLAEVMTEQEPNIKAKGLALTVSYDASQTYVAAIDRDKFKQVVLNTIDNSVKYTPSGSLDVRLVKDTKRGMIRFEVKDTGVGIDPAVMSKLFQKFSRAPKAGEANIHGTGLGLYIASEIMKAHRGKIWAESEGEGKGSKFIIEIPEVK